jgi:hypothetical protein
MPMPKLCFDEVVRQKDGSWLPRAVVMAMDERRRRSSYDDDPEETNYEIAELLGLLDPGEKSVVRDSLRKMVGDRRRARDDQEFGPDFSDPGKAAREVIGGEDRRGRGRAHDARQDDRLLRLVPELASQLDEFGRPLWPSR